MLLGAYMFGCSRFPSEGTVLTSVATFLAQNDALCSEMRELALVNGKGLIANFRVRKFFHILSMFHPTVLHALFLVN